jgi:hypothetical protein
VTPGAAPAASGRRSVFSPPLASHGHGSALPVPQLAARGERPAACRRSAGAARTASKADTCLVSRDTGLGRWRATPGFDLDDDLVDDDEDEDEEDDEQQDDGDEEDDEDESVGDEPETWQVIPLTSPLETA